MKTYLALLILGCLNLIACTEPPPADDAAAGSNNSSGNGISVNAEPTVSVSTAELIADQGFTFDSQYDLTVQVDLPALAEESTIVNICHPTSAGAIDRNNCVSRAALSNGRLDLVLNMAAHQQALVMEIWQRSDMRQPTSYSWSVGEGTVWQVQD
ncbi:hypothetical protein [Oceanospirillum sanctuarii]|uniref:hypothetical protein n=1 Tax=Oceanospirillum sanctuarii TaxID=1434821 RepID=UPI000A3D03EC|nr:hypothetical protein [Oceanospirillum sanctuarii]